MSEARQRLLGHFVLWEERTHILDNCWVQHILLTECKTLH